MNDDHDDTFAADAAAAHNSAANNTDVTLNRTLLLFGCVTLQEWESGGVDVPRSILKCGLRLSESESQIRSATLDRSLTDL